MNPQDLRYTKEHEWVRVESGGAAVIGVTQFVAEHIGDVVFLDLPEVGAEISQFEKLGEIESVKAVSDLNAPISGSVLEQNEQAVDNPQIVNEDPYDSAWLVKASMKDIAELDNLMSAEEYDKFLATQEH